MSRAHWDVAVWIGGLFTLAFLPLELLARFWHGCPWDTLTGSVRLAVKDWHPIWWIVLITLLILWGHFDENWRVRWLILVAGLGFLASLIHFLLTR